MAMNGKSVSNVNLRFFVNDDNELTVLDTAETDALVRYVSDYYQLDPADEDDYEEITYQVDRIEGSMYTLADIMARMAKSETGCESFPA